MKEEKKNAASMLNSDLIARTKNSRNIFGVLHVLCGSFSVTDKIRLAERKLSNVLVYYTPYTVLYSIIQVNIGIGNNL